MIHYLLIDFSGQKIKDVKTIENLGGFIFADDEAEIDVIRCIKSAECALVG